MFEPLMDLSQTHIPAMLEVQLEPKLQLHTLQLGQVHLSALHWTGIEYVDKFLPMAPQQSAVAAGNLPVVMFDLATSFPLLNRSRR